MEVWIAYDGTKVLEQILVEDDDEPRWSVDVEGCTVAQMDRVGDLTAECFDPDTISWVENPTFKEHEINFNTGKEAIAEARLMKTIEARLILSGVAVEGILSAEAEIRGSTVEELAGLVLEKRQEFIDNELNRQKASLKEPNNV